MNKIVVQVLTKEVVSMTDINLAKLKDYDIRTVDRASLVDISEVAVPDDLPQSERMKMLITQIKNPYCFKVGKWVVGVDFINTESTLEDKMQYIVR
jgi:hypothetical protein